MLRASEGFCKLLPVGVIVWGPISVIGSLYVNVSVQTLLKLFSDRSIYHCTLLFKKPVTKPYARNSFFFCVSPQL
jgi:hypothetical protein